MWKTRAPTRECHISTNKSCNVYVPSVLTGSE
jgi:hypothetical protein